MIDPIGDSTFRVLGRALTGLSARQRVIADNVANLQTPGFKAGRVDFESSLASAWQGGGDASAATIRVTRSTAPGGLDGNNVDLDQETLAATETGLSYQLGVQAMTDRFKVLRSAMGGA
ncbi:flagellar basal body rod protein FlgB [Phycicoccus sonneratiae]|uniref:Flagellar basal body rod protein FlgB n=1 Tax=Phycicoccus sonneratiae TaxID=2807628 RepID=A0ABS2CNL0_9MICO|nr:flagellar basal body protein [Phycicoccus sonneraticus]MBM6401467.1 flagellar biosynthesis protein FlgB [Phycicoccus sonneraticus]